MAILKVDKVGNWLLDHLDESTLEVLGAETIVHCVILMKAIDGSARLRTVFRLDAETDYAKNIDRSIENYEGKIKPLLIKKIIGIFKGTISFQEKKLLTAYLKNDLAHTNYLHEFEYVQSLKKDLQSFLFDARLLLNRWMPVALEQRLDVDYILSPDTKVAIPNKMSTLKGFNAPYVTMLLTALAYLRKG